VSTLSPMEGYALPSSEGATLPGFKLGVRVAEAKLGS
jgi:hypothetical protein